MPRAQWRPRRPGARRSRRLLPTRTATAATSPSPSSPGCLSSGPFGSLSAATPIRSSSATGIAMDDGRRGCSRGPRVAVYDAWPAARGREPRPGRCFCSWCDSRRGVQPQPVRRPGRHASRCRAADHRPPAEAMTARDRLRLAGLVFTVAGCAVVLAATPLPTPPADRRSCSSGRPTSGRQPQRSASFASSRWRSTAHARRHTHRHRRPSRPLGPSWQRRATASRCRSVRRVLDRVAAGSMAAAVVVAPARAGAGEAPPPTPVLRSLDTPPPTLRRLEPAPTRHRSHRASQLAEAPEPAPRQPTSWCSQASRSGRSPSGCYQNGTGARRPSTKSTSTGAAWSR